MRYLEHCEEINLSPSTRKAYKLDIAQFMEFASISAQHEGFIITKDAINLYANSIKNRFAERTAQRKFASIRVFLGFLEEEGVLSENPIKDVSISFRIQPEVPKTVSINEIECLFKAAWDKHHRAATPFEEFKTLRDIAVLELIFSTGLRVCEMCALNNDDISFNDRTISIKGHSSRARTIKIENEDVLNTLRRYAKSRYGVKSECFFVYNVNKPCRFSEQSVRAVIKRLSTSAGIEFHITPNMIRHTFITLLLNEDVKIQDMQSILGHGSLLATYVNLPKGTAIKSIPQAVNPRKFLLI